MRRQKKSHLDQETKMRLFLPADEVRSSSRIHRRLTLPAGICISVTACNATVNPPGPIVNPRWHHLWHHSLWNLDPSLFGHSLAVQGLGKVNQVSDADLPRPPIGILDAERINNADNSAYGLECSQAPASCKTNARSAGYCYVC